MKVQTAAIALLSLVSVAPARAEESTMTGSKPMLTYEDVRKVAPPLAAYTQNRLLGDVWKRPGLAPRDRSIVTLAALIARNQTIEMPYHLNLALDNGVKPREISEIITHLAFYAGLANAMSAVAVAKDVFAARNIGAEELPAVSVTPLQLDRTVLLIGCRDGICCGAHRSGSLRPVLNVHCELLKLGMPGGIGQVLPKQLQLVGALVRPL